MSKKLSKNVFLANYFFILYVRATSKQQKTTTTVTTTSFLSRKLKYSKIIKEMPQFVSLRSIIAIFFLRMYLSILFSLFLALYHLEVKHLP